jgi:FG-GAP-like repeat
MATITVTNLNDGGAGSLRDALGLANPGDTINFDPSLAGGTLALTSGELAISKNLTIDGDIAGNGTPGITIDAGNASRVFDELGAPGISATLDGLVITNGSAAVGGGIAVGTADNLTLENSRVTNNYASTAGGGIYGGGGSSLTLLNTSVFGNTSGGGGGGIYARTSLATANTTFSGNYSKTTGGAIDLYSGASAVLTNTTLSGNESGDRGGGVYGRASGIWLYNSTLTGNYAGTAGGGIYNLNGAGASLVLANSIIAGNAAPASGPDLDLDGSGLYLHGNNILGSAPANANPINTASGYYTQIDGTSRARLEDVFARVAHNPNTGVLSGVLADNGGPVRTVAINPIGMASNAGDNSALPQDSLDLNNNHNTTEPLPVDARGFARVTGGSVDIGAFEQQPSSVFVVTTLADEPYNGGTLAQEKADGSGLSLREALGLANQDPTTADIIVFDPALIGGGTHGVNDGTLLLTNGALPVNGNVTIEGDVNGDGAPDITIDGQGASQDFVITGGRVALDGLTVTGGYGYVNGGGIALERGTYALANVVISNSTITNNSAAYGGGISIDRGDSLLLTNSTLAGNSAFYVGGGILNKGTVALRGTTVSGNTSGYTGGGIANQGTLYAVDTTIANNQITYGGPFGLFASAGGGLCNSGSATLANTTISGNTGSYAGGGIYNSYALTLTNTTIANNNAYNGGGLYNALCGCGNVAVYNSTLTGNNAQQFGGGIDNANGTVALTNTLVAGNRAGYQGPDVNTGYGTTSYAGVNLFSQSGIGRPGVDITQPDLTQVFATLTTLDPDGTPNSGDEFQAGTLGNNGGPVQTVAILINGSAQNTGSTLDLPSDTLDLNNNGDTFEALPVDARGEPRISGAAVDIGAVEAQEPVLTAQDIAPNANQAFSTTVATFTDSDTTAVTGDFAAAIDWGDGQTTTGTVSGSNGSFTVTGSHTYTAGGQDAMTVTLSDSQPDTAPVSASATATVRALSGQMSLTAATENTALSAGTTVATFTDTNLTDAAGDFTATIAWGDGSTTAGTVVGSRGSFAVQGGHTYPDEGNDPASVTLTHTADGFQGTASGSVSVADDDVFTPHGINFTANAQRLFTGTVATFSDTDTVNVGGDFIASIDWGDGQTTAGTVSGGNGTLTVGGSHTYGAGGQDTVRVTLTDDPSSTATSTATVRSLSGQMSLTAATEHTALSAGTIVATFTDSDFSDTAGDFSAMIEWGDGTTSAGTVSGSASAGAFTVEGGHTYADEGSYPASVILTHTADAFQGTASGNVSVADADVLTPHGTTITSNVNQAFAGPVATFSDSDTANVAGDFTASIDWGDGQTTTGTVSGGNGTFTVGGSHTYSAGGQDTVKITLADDPASTATTTAFVRSLSGQMALSAATEGTALPAATPVATFTDTNPNDAAGDFTATIAWGDGATTSGTVVGSNGSFTVEGGHTYADEGSDPASVTLTYNPDPLSATTSGFVTVAEGDGLTAHGTSFTVNPQQTFSGTVATFSDSYTANVTGDFTASIDWGDGFTTTGTVSGGNGSFTVGGSHTYATGGQDTVKVQLTDDAPGTATATATTIAFVRSLSGQMTLTSATEGSALPNSTPIATFSDTSTGDQASDFAATINWGDGTATAGTVVGSGGSFTVDGGHTYADEGSDAASVTLTHTADQLQTTASGTIAVAEGDVLTAHGTSFTVNPNQSFSGTVATFSDSDAANVAGDFTASIDWGDGQTTTGTVSGGNGTFTVGGSHTYSAGGQDAVKVTLADDAPGTATATATTTAIVASLAGQMALSAATEGTALSAGTPVATFADTNPNDAAGDFTATIAWGDGATSVGTVVGSNGSFTVESGHTYADEGSDPASVILTRTADELQASASGTIAVGEGDVLIAHGTSFTASAHQAFAGTVATFSDSDTANVAGDFTASIDWGDGQTTAGTVSGGNGTFTVGGSHTYGAGGQDTVKVTLADDAPGTATATATTSATVTGSNPYDVNGDTISDLVFQNTNGTPAVWLWNGAAPTAEATLPNPGSLWNVVTSRDVNGDGKSDLIWQNCDGTPAIWLMNGTTPTAYATLPYPGANWNLDAAGDVNGDGKSDLIWQNCDGTLAVWLMNGTTPTGYAALNNPGTDWNVVGTADYNADGRDDILLQNCITGNLMIDLMNGTSIASTVSIAVGDPSWHAVSTGEFNGQAEIAFQNSNGTPALWLMNGTTPAAAAVLPNPGAAWKLISIDHFTPDGHADLLFQNTNGALGLWEMNGTSIAATLNLPNPGAGWQSVNGHPFATG